MQPLFLTYSYNNFQTSRQPQEINISNMHLHCYLIWLFKQIFIIGVVGKVRFDDRQRQDELPKLEFSHQSLILLLCIKPTKGGRANILSLLFKKERKTVLGTFLIFVSQPGPHLAILVNR